MGIFDNIIKTDQYQKYLAMIPEDKRKDTIDSLKRLCEEFERKILHPLEVLKNR